MADLELADIVRGYGEAYASAYPVTARQRAALRSIAACRTAQLGGHIYRCSACGRETPLYNSCGNRHCPKCQAGEAARWVEARASDLLPVPYFHVVFTVPEELRPLVYGNDRWVYDTLFRCAKEALVDVGATREHLGARLGGLMVLHTWSSTLVLHPHVHCIVPGGGVEVDGEGWVAAAPDYLVPVRVLAAVFRGKMVASLEAAWRRREVDLSALPDLEHPQAFESWSEALRSKTWVVYAKPPFAGPEAVLRYLARYTHRVAISNARLISLDEDHVVFRYRDRRCQGHWRTMRLHAVEFLRRFLQHVLPYRFVRIRYFGWMANRYRQENLERIRGLLGIAGAGEVDVDTEELRDSPMANAGSADGVDPGEAEGSTPPCPHCRGDLRLDRVLPRPPPSTASRAPP